MTSRALLVALILALATAAPAAAKPATPTPGTSGTPGTSAPLDLAALVLHPADLADPGYGVSNGGYQTLAQTAAQLNATQGGTDADLPGVKSALTKAGWRQGYFLDLAIPSGDDPTKVGGLVYLGLNAYADATGAAAGYDLVRTANAAAGYLKASGGQPVGKRSVLTRKRSTNSSGAVVAELDLVFQTQTVVAELDLFDYAGQAPAVETMQALAATLAQRLTSPPKTPGLSLRAPHLAGTGVSSAYEYYKRLSGVQFGYYGEAGTQVKSDDRFYAGSGVTDVWSADQGVASADGKDPYYGEYNLGLYAFDTAAHARSALTTFSQNFLSDPVTGYSNVQAVANPTKLGDDRSALVSFTYDRGGGVSTSGFKYYVVVGSTLAEVLVEAVPGAPQAAAEAVTRAVAACLKQIPLPRPAGARPGSAPPEPGVGSGSRRAVSVCAEAPTPTGLAVDIREPRRVGMRAGLPIHVGHAPAALAPGRRSPPVSEDRPRWPSAEIGTVVAVDAAGGCHPGRA